MKSVTTLRARYAETDQMGIIHHSVYITWFEVGRTDFIRKLDKSYAEIEKEGLYLPVIGADVSYKTPAKYEDVIAIETSIAAYNGVRLKFHYKAVREADGALIAEGHTEHCWTNTELRPVKLKSVWPELHERLLQSVEEA